MELCGFRCGCRVARGGGPGAEGTGRGGRLPRAQAGCPARPGRARRRSLGRGGRGGAIPGPRRARCRRRSGRLAASAALAFAVTRPPLAETGPVAEARPVTVAGPVTVARTLAGQWRGSRPHPTLPRAAGRRHSPRGTGDPAGLVLTPTPPSRARPPLTL